MTDATYRVEVAKQQFVFSAAHFITFAGDICERIHGHNYGVRAMVEGPLDENRYVVDFIALRDAVLEQTKVLDHHVILPEHHAEIKLTSDSKETTATFRDRRWVFPNEDCVILPVVNTTAEEIARVIAERVRDRMRERFGDAITFLEIGVDENEGQWGVCRIKW
ncbi:6-pyruvoyl trahydropterin synthase family protein [Novipirellula artificiosorum]|uniref:6-carboxy-5,6,7,8-tetrahydropterin synthase n=1 Tax=Novipirellula artificiosorum TaxID=2528016 RepID=A0A5C6DKD8_9BACT|nr:6-carboxytetrahydropterin synthase [Novipirellula artificiosorum]TWU36091.1 6-pyruvoyl tetrahydropterin synthase [Novipirellula artificiosorum]